MERDDDILPADLIAQARAMWQSEFWQRIARYCRARRDELVSAVEPPADERAIWRREGQLVELNRFLRGDAFLAEVLRDAQARHAAQAAEAEPEAPAPSWMASIRTSSDVVN